METMKKQISRINEYINLKSGNPKVFYDIMKSIIKNNEDVNTAFKSMFIILR